MARSKRMPSRPSRAAALLLFATISWSVNQATDPLHGITREDLNLTGNVREVVVEEARLLSSSSELREGARIPIERIVFDEDGRVSEWVEFDRSAEPDTIRRYTYSDGLLALEEEYRLARWPSETIAYTHDIAGGRTTAEVRAGGGTLRKTLVYERDGDGKLVAVTEYDPSGIEITKVAYSYSATGKRADRFDPEGELTSWSVETFDASGRLVEVSLHTAGSEDPPFTISYEYDSHGNVVLEETSGRLSIGFVIVSPTPSETKTAYEYTYDGDGNWVKRVTSVWVSDAEDPHWRATAATYRSFRYVE